MYIIVSRGELGPRVHTCYKASMILAESLLGESPKTREKLYGKNWYRTIQVRYLVRLPELGMNIFQN